MCVFDDYSMSQMAKRYELLASVDTFTVISLALLGKEGDQCYYRTHILI